MKKKLLSIAISAAMAVACLGSSLFGTTDKTNLFGETLIAEAAGESLSLTSAEAAPGETVTLQVKAYSNDELVALDTVIGWDDTSLTSGSADMASGVAGASANSDGLCSIVAYSASVIADGTIATIDFTVPDDAEIGTVYDIEFTSVSTFAIYSGDDIADSVYTSGGTITVTDESSESTEPTQSNPVSYPQSLSLTSAEAEPGETVTLQVMITCNNNFESMDVVLTWDDTSLTSTSAAGTNGVSVASSAGDGYCTLVAYGSDAIADGAVATIDFTVPADAANGTVYNIDFSTVTTFAIFGGDDIAD